MLKKKKKNTAPPYPEKVPAPKHLEKLSTPTDLIFNPPPKKKWKETYITFF